MQTKIEFICAFITLILICSKCENDKFEKRLNTMNGMAYYIYNMEPKLMYIKVAVQIKVVNLMCVK